MNNLAMLYERDITNPNRGDYIRDAVQIGMCTMTPKTTSYNLVNINGQLQEYTDFLGQG